jgi:phosphate-selective porin OprO and OprP
MYIVDNFANLIPKTTFINFSCFFMAYFKTSSSVFFNKRVFVLLIFLVSATFCKVKAQTTNDVLNLMVNNKTITEEQADSVRAEAAIKQQEADANKKSFFISAARSMKLSGYTQVRFQQFDETGKISGTDIRRARLNLQGDVTPYWSYQFQVDFAGGAKLLDAVADFKPYDFLNVTIGQTKIPLSFENQISDNKLEANDRSQIIEALVARGKDVNGNHNGRDLGVMVYGSFLKINEKNRIDYRVGVFNGEGINTVDSNDAKSSSGRLIAHLIKGLDVGGSFYSGWDRFSTAKGVATSNQERSRYGVEFNYELKRFYFRGEYMQGKDGTISREGWYLQSGYFVIANKVQLLAKYDVYDPNKSKTADMSTRYIVGATWQFNNYAKLALNYNFCEEEGTSVNNNFASLQFQIGF